MLERPLFPVSRVHLDVLSDDVGVMQHAVGSRPDPVHGYCTDDVARALQVDLLHQRELGWDAVASSAWRSLRFLDDAFDRATGRFRNFRRMDGTWLEETASEDSQGRAMLTLGETMLCAPDDRMVELAGSLFALALPKAQRLGALRAQSSVLLGCDAAVHASRSEPTVRAYRRLATRLWTTFGSSRAPAWPWPEPRLTYENALPAHALLRAGSYFEDRAMTEVGLDTLDWLIAAQLGPTGVFSAVGNGWWPRGGVKSRFDQQPIEATALLLAAESAFRITWDVKYRSACERAYAWFLGGNDLEVNVADPERGASYDGLTPEGVNTNQGAESTLMWLTALEHIRGIRGERSTAARPGDAVLVAS